MLKYFCWIIIIMAACCSCSDISRTNRRLRILESKFMIDIELLRDDLINERDEREKNEIIFREYISRQEKQSSAVTSINAEDYKQRFVALEQHQSEMERSFEEWKSNERANVAHLESKISELENSVVDIQAMNADADGRIQELSTKLAEKNSNFDELLENFIELKKNTQTRERTISHLQLALRHEKAHRHELRHHLDHSLLEKANAIREVVNRITPLDMQVQELRSTETQFRNDICDGVPESEEKDSCGNNFPTTGKATSCCIQSGFTVLDNTLGAKIAELKTEVQNFTTQALYSISGHGDMQKNMSDLMAENNQLMLAQRDMQMNMNEIKKGNTQLKVNMMHMHKNMSDLTTDNNQIKAGLGGMHGNMSDLIVEHNQLKSVQRDMQRNMADIKTENTQLVGVVIDVKRNMSDQAAELKAVQANMLRKMTELTTKVSKNSRTTPVAFYAYNPHSPVQKYKAFVFRNTHYNAGNDYNTSDGSFTAPVNGTYLFSSTIIAKSSSYMYARIATGKSLSSVRWIGFLYTALQSGEWTSASDTCVAHINSGDKVWIMNYDAITTYFYSSFMGVLLQED